MKINLKNLKIFNIGSSRIVYELNDDKVIKKAKDNKGKQQNKREYELFTRRQWVDT